jgi:hypothetical protein
MDFRPQSASGEFQERLLQGLDAHEEAERRAEAIEQRERHGFWYAMNITATILGVVALISGIIAGNSFNTALWVSAIALFIHLFILSKAIEFLWDVEGWGKPKTKIGHSFQQSMELSRTIENLSKGRFVTKEEAKRNELIRFYLFLCLAILIALIAGKGEMAMLCSGILMLFSVLLVFWSKSHLKKLSRFLNNKETVG